MSRLLLLPLLVACGEPSGDAPPRDVDLSFATFEVHAAYFAPAAYHMQDSPFLSYTLEARSWDGACGDGAPDGKGVFAGLSRRGGAIAEGADCAVGASGADCAGGLVILAGGATYEAVSGTVHVVSMEADRLVVDVDAQVSTVGRSCTEGDPRETEIVCTCTSGETLAPGGDCPTGATERLRLRIEGELCPDRCVCDVPGADACACPAP